MLNDMYIQELTEVILPPIKNVWGICKQITILILYHISSRVFAPKQVCNIVFIVPLKPVNLVYQLFPLSGP
jgi:hypothetical protein